jgi:hypothetical protein
MGVRDRGKERRKNWYKGKAEGMKGLSYRPVSPHLHT